MAGAPKGEALPDEESACGSEKLDPWAGLPAAGVGYTLNKLDEGAGFDPAGFYAPKRPVGLLVPYEPKLEGYGAPPAGPNPLGFD